jgi:hypothetical protein
MALVPFPTRNFYYIIWYIIYYMPYTTNGSETDCEEYRSHRKGYDCLIRREV